jgi:hypothetical protein
MKTNIVPVTIFPDSAVSLEIMGANVRKFADEGSAIVVWALLDSKNNILRTGSEELTGADYQGWNDDAPYLMNWLLPRLALTAA